MPTELGTIPTTERAGEVKTALIICISVGTLAQVLSEEKNYLGDLRKDHFWSSLFLDQSGGYNHVLKLKFQKISYMLLHLQLCFNHSIDP